MLRKGLPPDALAGGLFALSGLGVLAVGGDYPAGTAARMGPGYFPQLLGWVLTFLGLCVLALAWRSRPPAAAGRLVWAWLAVPLFWLIVAGLGRGGLTGIDLALGALLVLAWPVSKPLFWVSAGVSLFALALEPLGLALAALALVLAARRAAAGLTWSAALALWLGLLAVSLAIFVWGLGTPLPVWPRFPGA